MTKIPNLYLKGFDTKRFPIYFPGEEYSFYLNLDTPTTDEGFANFVLRLIPCNDPDNFVTGFGTLEKDELNEVQYNIYCENFIFPAVPFGNYKFGIWDTVAGVYKAVSNVFTVETSENAEKTTVVKYRSPYDFLGFGYSRLPDYYNVFRLPLNLIDVQYESQKSQYRNATNNKWRNYKSYRDQIFKVESYYFDDVAHEAMSAVYEHEVIMLNSTLYVVKSSYEIENVVTNKFKKGSIELYTDNSSRSIQGALIPASQKVTVRLGGIAGPVVLMANPGQTVVILSPYTTAYEIFVI